MAKALNLNIGGTLYTVTPTKLERKKLYGWTELRATDPSGSICQSATLETNSQTILPKGAIKLGILKENGIWMDKSELVAIRLDGNKAEFVPSSFDSEILPDRKASMEELLNLVISSVYQMDGDEAVVLATALGNDIYSFKFNYRGDYEVSDAFLLSNGTTPYLLVGVPAQFELIGLEDQGVIDEPDDEVEVEEDELDFSMM